MTTWQFAKIVFSFGFDGANEWTGGNERVKFGVEMAHDHNYVLCAIDIYYVKEDKYDCILNFWGCIW
jgi:hypothetical protein